MCVCVRSRALCNIWTNRLFLNFTASNGKVFEYNLEEF